MNANKYKQISARFFKCQTYAICMKRGILDNKIH